MRVPEISRLGRGHRGFTLLEVLISMFILTVGLVSMLGVFATAMAATQTAQQDMIAKQLAQQAMETIFTARETQNIVWSQIQNVGGPGSPGIFRTGLQAIKQPGTDGIIDTINDGGSAGIPPRMLRWITPRLAASIPESEYRYPESLVVTRSLPPQITVRHIRTRLPEIL